MFIEHLQREMAVCSYDEIEEFLARDSGRWQVVSIREPDHPEAVLKDALKAHAVVFKDIFTGGEDLGPNAAHLEGILRFVQRSENAPLLIQCWAGRSRSTAVALVILVQSLWRKEIVGAELVRTAVDELLKIRPVAAPNRLVLRLGLEQFLPQPLASTLAKALIMEPCIRQKFFH